MNMFRNSSTIVAVAFAIFFSTRFILVGAIDYDIYVGTTPLTVNGFDDANNAAELSLSFTLADSGASSTVSCAAYEASGSQCDTTKPISAITVSDSTIGTAVTADVNIDLATISSSVAYSYNTGTHVGTLDFCTRCATDDPTAGEIGYAEILATVTITMEESIPSINVDVQQFAATSDTKDAGAAAYNINAFQCIEGTYASDSSTLSQGDFLGICVQFSLTGVDCDHFDELSIDGFSIINSGSIDNTDISSGDDSSSPSIDGTCFIKTQFPSSLVPSDGSLDSLPVTGTVVLHFGRRKLRVGLSPARSNTSERQVQATEEESKADFDLAASVQVSKKNLFGNNDDSGGVSSGPIFSWGTIGTIAVAALFSTVL